MLLDIRQQDMMGTMVNWDMHYPLNSKFIYIYLKNCSSIQMKYICGLYLPYLLLFRYIQTHLSFQQLFEVDFIDTILKMRRQRLCEVKVLGKVTQLASNWDGKDEELKFYEPQPSYFDRKLVGQEDTGNCLFWGHLFTLLISDSSSKGSSTDSD